MTEPLKEAVRAHEAEQEATKNAPLTYSTCGLTEEDIEHWQTRYDALYQDTKRLKKLLQAAKDVPPPLTVTEEKALEELWQAGEAEGPQEKAPAWASQVTALRDQLRPCGLRFHEEDGSQTTVFLLFCKQRNPMQVHCLRMQATEAQPVDPNSPHPDW
eukprot:8536713-Lingulodinium_polyedra.AAC.1